MKKSEEAIVDLSTEFNTYYATIDGLLKPSGFYDKELLMMVVKDAFHSGAIAFRNKKIK